MNARGDASRTPRDTSTSEGAGFRPRSFRLCARRGSDRFAGGAGCSTVCCGIEICKRHTCALRVTGRGRAPTFSIVLRFRCLVRDALRHIAGIRSNEPEEGGSRPPLPLKTNEEESWGRRNATAVHRLSGRIENRNVEPTVIRAVSRGPHNDREGSCTSIGEDDRTSRRLDGAGHYRDAAPGNAPDRGSDNGVGLSPEESACRGSAADFHDAETSEPPEEVPAQRSLRQMQKFPPDR
jgi:hypothetical protein